MNQNINTVNVLLAPHHVQMMYELIQKTPAEALGDSFLYGEYELFRRFPLSSLHKAYVGLLEFKLQQKRTPKIYIRTRL
jgi:hypothetical protein